MLDCLFRSSGVLQTLTILDFIRDVASLFTNSDLMKHIRVRHDGERNYRCPACDKTFGEVSF